MYIDIAVENIVKDLKFEVGDHVRILKYKNISTKGYTSNWSDEVFVIKKLKSTTMKISNRRPWYRRIECFMKKSCKRQKKFRIEKLIQKKDDKLYI